MRIRTAFFILIALISLHVCDYASASPPRALRGEIDLSGWDFGRDGVVPLNGEWEFYWNELLTPEDFRNRSTERRPAFVPVPRPWFDYKINGIKLPARGYATYRLRLKLRNHDELMGLKVNFVMLAARIWADGEPVCEIGRVGRSGAEMVSQRRVAVGNFKPRGATTEVIVQVSNFHYDRGGILGDIKCGTARQIQALRDRRVAFDMALFGSLFIMAIYHLSLYYFRRRDPAVLFFSIYSFLFAVRTLQVNEIFITALFPALDWALMLRIELIAFYMLTLVGAMFYSSLFLREMSLPFVRCAQAISLVGALLALLGPPGLFGYLRVFYQVLATVVLVYIIYILILASVRRREGALWFLAGFAFLFITGLNDLLYHSLISLGIITTGQLLPFGILLFIFAQAFVLSRRFAHDYAIIENKDRELADTNRAYRQEIIERRAAENELKSYRERLEEIVRERTAELRGANEKLQIEMNERRRAQDELLKRSNIESLGVFAGGIAHDFNNLLTAIMANISLAMMYTRSDDQLAEILAEAERAALRTKDLTQQLLTFSRGGAPIKRTTSIHDLLMNSADFVLRGSNVRCEYSIPADLWNADVDIGQFSQVIHNLIVNAREAMPHGGRIDLSAQNVCILQRNPLALPKGEYIRIVVRDEGEGIPREHLNRIFDPYFTTKKKGSGLGLAISYSIVKNHGGYITAESVPGRGARFNIHIPASKEPLVRAAATASSDFSGKGRVLVMDDEESILKINGLMLKNLGFDVEYARNGDEAVRLYEKAMQDGAAFDVVIMDLSVPEKLGGLDAHLRILSLDRRARVIVSSGYVNDPIMSNYREDGLSGVLVKPYTFEELRSLLHEVLAPEP